MFSTPIQMDRARSGDHQKEGGRQLVGRQLVGRPVLYITNVNTMRTPWGHKHHFQRRPRRTPARRKKLTGAIQSGLHP